jgi:hypothetical protein
VKRPRLKTISSSSGSVAARVAPAGSVRCPKVVCRRSGCEAPWTKSETWRRALSQRMLSIGAPARPKVATLPLESPA